MGKSNMAALSSSRQRNLGPQCKGASNAYRECGEIYGIFAHAVLTSLIPMRNDEIPCN